MPNARHRLTYYPEMDMTQINAGTKYPITPQQFKAFYSSWFAALKPLLKHIEDPEQVYRLVTRFNQIPPSWGLSEFTEDVAHLFPVIVFAQLHRTIAETRSKDPSRAWRNKWVRGRMLKDLKKCESRVKKLRDKVIRVIVVCEKSERDQGLRMLDHVLDCVLNEVHGRSIRTLVRSLT